MSPALHTGGLLGSHGVDVREGPRLLRHLGGGPSLEAHARVHGDLQVSTVDELLDLTRSAGLRGRGGAGFPFATKLEVAAARRTRAEVVVNASEGEPASFKDAALVLARPHLVLDGASVTARACMSASAVVKLSCNMRAIWSSARP